MINDALKITKRHITPEGYLQAVASITCVGVQDYYGYELQSFVDSKLDADKLYAVYRPPTTVFADETIASAKLKPITDDHPDDDVSSHNHKILAIGTLGENPINIDGRQLAFSFLCTDHDAVKKIEEGTHQLSSGYDAKIKEEKGLYEGKPYDMVFDSPMLINHVALLEGGRCGEGAKIFDKKGCEMFKRKDKKVADLDTDMLMSKLSEKLLPDLQKLIESDDFQTKLAGIMGDKLASEMTAAEPEVSDNPDNPEPLSDNPDDFPEQLPTQQPDVDVSLDDACKKDSKMVKDSHILRDAITKEANKRVRVLHIAKRLNPDIEFTGQTAKRLLVDALKPYMKDEKLDKKSEDYLLGVAQTLASRKQEGSQYLTHISSNITDAKSDENVVQMPTDALSIRQLERG